MSNQVSRTMSLLVTAMAQTDRDEFYRLVGDLQRSVDVFAMQERLLVQEILAVAEDLPLDRAERLVAALQRFVTTVEE